MYTHASICTHVYIFRECREIICKYYLFYLYYWIYTRKDNSCGHVVAWNECLFRLRPPQSPYIAMYPSTLSMSGCSITNNFLFLLKWAGFKLSKQVRFSHWELMTHFLLDQTLEKHTEHLLVMFQWLLVTSADWADCHQQSLMVSSGSNCCCWFIDVCEWIELPLPICVNWTGTILTRTNGIAPKDYFYAGPHPLLPC